jgi:hypothetical protein
MSGLTRDEKGEMILAASSHTPALRTMPGAAHFAREHGGRPCDSRDDFNLQSGRNSQVLSALFLGIDAEVKGCPSPGAAVRSAL